jgi:hypothetical protein
MWAPFVGALLYIRSLNISLHCHIFFYYLYFVNPTIHIMKIMNATRDSKTFLSVDKMNSYLIKIKFDMHLGTIDEKESPNVYGISFDCYCDCNEVPHETGEEFKKVNNLINKEHIHF